MRKIIFLTYCFMILGSFSYAGADNTNGSVMTSAEWSYLTGALSGDWIGGGHVFRTTATHDMKLLMEVCNYNEYFTSRNCSAARSYFLAPKSRTVLVSVDPKGDNMEFKIEVPPVADRLILSSPQFSPSTFALVKLPAPRLPHRFIIQH